MHVVRDFYRYAKIPAIAVMWSVAVMSTRGQAVETRMSVDGIFLPLTRISPASADNRQLPRWAGFSPLGYRADVPPAVHMKPTTAMEYAVFCLRFSPPSRLSTWT